MTDIEQRVSRLERIVEAEGMSDPEWKGWRTELFVFVFLASILTFCGLLVWFGMPFLFPNRYH